MLGPGEGLPGRVWAAEAPAWITGVPTEAGFPRVAAAARAGLNSAFAFPVRGAALLAVIELFTAELRDADEPLLDTMTSLGSQIGQFVERRRAEQAVRDGDARKSAILNAAFDCVVTMDHNGDIVEVNQATERTFGYTAAEMVGPRAGRADDPARPARSAPQGAAPVHRDRPSLVINHPIELRGMRSDGSEFPVELAITRPELPGPPLFCGYLRDVTERTRAEKALRRLADEQAALRRVATAVAARPSPATCSRWSPRRSGGCSARRPRTWSATTADGTAPSSAAGTPRAPAASRWATPSCWTATPSPPACWRTERPARVDDYDEVPGELAAQLRELGFRSAVAAPVMLGGRLWGAMIVSSVHPEPFPRGAEQRIADFAELAAQALANAQARSELAASRARIVEAGDAERRRLERNLHDGAQQRLVSLAVNLRLAARALRSGRRALARGVRARRRGARPGARGAARARPRHPPGRAQRPRPRAGDRDARRPHRRCRCTYTIELDERLPEPVEAAAYYVVAEALTNAAKHANASEVTVRIERDDGFARIEVADDGIGGAGAGGGSGLRGLADRVEALGGRLALDSPQGEGTTVRAEIPSR